MLNEDDLQPVFSAKDCTQAIDEIKYSPNSKYLAVASHDTCIDIYAVTREYARVTRCQGHSATVNHLDWSADSGVLQSTATDYEILYWNPKNGHQVAANQRDTEWATWTSTLGFCVMGIWPDGADGTDALPEHSDS